MSPQVNFTAWRVVEKDKLSRSLEQGKERYVCRGVAELNRYRPVTIACRACAPRSTLRCPKSLWRVSRWKAIHLHDIGEGTKVIASVKRHGPVPNAAQRMGTFKNVRQGGF